jgi:hypothetical protein
MKSLDNIIDDGSSTISQESNTAATTPLPNSELFLIWYVTHDPYSLTTVQQKKIERIFPMEHLRNAMMDACMHAIILSGEKTELTCICVVAKKQSFRIGYYKQQSLRCVSL